MDIKKLADRMTAETEKIIYGKEQQIRLIIMALLAQGHVLLEDLPGVGPARRKALIKHFHTIKAIREADEQALLACPGVTKTVARAILEWSGVASQE